MKFNSYIIAAGITLMGFSATSCLDLEPKAQMGDNMVWNTADNFRLYANQFYGWVPDLSRGVSDNPHSDYRSDLLGGTSINNFSQGINVVPATDGTYNENYKRIFYTNLLLKNAEGFGDQEGIKIPVAEAKFFRAMCHFELVQNYGDVILLTSPLDLDSGELYGPRDDRGDVIDQCLKDLWEAADGLPDTPAEAGRVTKSAALALLSRIALYEGTWQKFHNGGKDATANEPRVNQLLTQARKAAKQVIDDNHYSLFYNAKLGNQSYRYMFILEDAQCNPAGLTKSNNTEYILASRRRLGDKYAQNITHAIHTSGNAVMASRKLANLYLCDDGLPIDKSPRFQGYDRMVSEFTNRDNRMTNTLVKPGEHYWDNDSKPRTKWDDSDLENSYTFAGGGGSGYHVWKWATEREVADYYESYDYPYIRYAEVLLNFAEASYELNNAITDDELNMSLNLVRNRVNPNMPKLTNAFASAHGLSMREEIRRERTVEFFLEGFRLDDLKRWATAPDEMAMDMVGVKIRGTQYEATWNTTNLDAEGCIIIFTDRGAWKNNSKLYLNPLPSDQRQLNPQLGQNPQWN